MNICD